MRATRFEYSSEFEAPVSRLWAVHMRPDALGRLSPAVLGLSIEDPGEGVKQGSVVVARAGWWPLRHTWEALHTEVDEHRSFTDVAIRSPFPFWTHQHQFERSGADRSRLRDVVWFVPPRWLRSRLGTRLVGAGLRLLFAWRHRQTRRLLERKSSTAISTRPVSALGG